MLKSLQLLILPIFFVWTLAARDYVHPVDYYAKARADRARGHIYKDLQYLLIKIRKNRDRLREIYLGEAQFLKKEKIDQAKIQFYRAQELFQSAKDMIKEHRRDYHKDTALLQVLEKKLTKLNSEVHSYSVFITKLHPLDLYARNYHLRPGKLLNFRKFENKSTGAVVSGRELVDILKKAYFHFNLRTKTSLGIAEKLLKPVVENYPEFLPAAFWLARVHFDQDRITEAQLIMSRLIEVDPTLVISKSLDSKLLSEDDLIDYSLPKTPIISHDNLPIDLSPRPQKEVKPNILRTAFAFCLPGANSPVAAGGLDLADVVYEYNHNAQETRLLALIGQTPLKSHLIGPLVQLHSVDLDQIYYLDPLIIHKGLQPGTNIKRSTLQIGTIDSEIGYDAFVRREEQAYPHQFYTSLDRLVDLGFRYRKILGNARKGLRFSRIESPYGANQIRAIHIPMTEKYTVSYMYKPEFGAYHRLINGNPHLDAFSGQVLHTSNVIIQKLENAKIDDQTHAGMDVFGEGPALIVVRGRAHEGTWRKSKLGSETRYFDNKNQEVHLSHGRTFIHLVPLKSKVRMDTFDKI